MADPCTGRWDAMSSVPHPGSPEELAAAERYLRRKCADAEVLMDMLGLNDRAMKSSRRHKRAET